MDMETELELTFKIADPEPIRQRLRELGAERIGQYEQRDTYFVVEKSFGKAKSHYCRLREEDDSAWLSYHVAEDHMKTGEYRTAVDDASATREILLQLGFNAEVVVKKQRELFTMEDSPVHVALDHVAELGWFVEVEIEDRYSKAREEAVQSVAARLGLHVDDAVEQGYPDML